MKSLVVYKINCADCRASYIGKTKRHLITRVEEHKTTENTKKNANNKFKDDHESAVYGHMSESGHQVDFNNVEILDSPSSDYKLKLKEAFYIKKYKPTLNVQIQSDLFKLFTMGN
ncbi:unnamed protein product [Brachionus calyciflorus]|uniref:GIY-YIG domain-containing protein n=1 Tax=Brachionus calyciflorus TaxID=104777 RepID=A0A813UCD0_9BILA|nr:unnamed protein product [Brachionus calyciflorus]